MNRKGWDNLSPKYRRRLERSGVTRSDYERGASLVQARGHFPKPKTRPVNFRRLRARSEVWNRYRHRAAKLQAYESIREAWRTEKLGGRFGTEQVLVETLMFYEGLEAEYEQEGEGGREYLGEYSDWYDTMRDEYGPEFDYPELDIYYHGTTKG